MCLIKQTFPNSGVLDFLGNDGRRGAGMTGHGGGRLMALSGRDGGGHCSALQLNQSSEGGEMQCSGTGTMSPEDQFWGRLCTVNTVHCALWIAL